MRNYLLSDEGITSLAFMSEKGKDMEKPAAPVRGGTSHKEYQITNHQDEYSAERCISRD